MVGVRVKVGVGAVGVKVGISVGVFVTVGVAVEVGGTPKNCSTVMEQAESSMAKIRRTEFFFMWRSNPFI
jgi:hypothetical protein